MKTLNKILLFVLIVSVLTFIALFGRLPALRRTPIGWLQRALCLHFPNALRQVDKKITGGQVTARSRRLVHYLFYEKNPIVLIIFLVLLTGSASLFLYNATSKLDTVRLMPIPALLFMPYYFTYKCVMHSAHYITHNGSPPEQEDYLHHYPYDHVLFRPGTVCKTCNLVKPARSKHCSLCKACVARADHHCPWVHNCLGRGNYRYFLALLLMLTVLQVYGAYLSYWILEPWLHLSGQHTPLVSWRRLTQFGDMFIIGLEAGGLGISGVGLLAAATAPLPLGLLVYHFYLIWAGMTTNESSKWADWRDDIADSLVFRASRAAVLARYQEQQNRQHENADQTELNRNDIVNKLGLLSDVVVDWPVSSDQVIVRTNDGRPPIGQERFWTRISSLSEVDNIYDLGGWDNLIEVLSGR